MTDKAPLVSILTPTYNRDDFLPLAIESVLNQDYTNYEMLVVDDGSTDNTREVMEKYLQDERIKYSYQENQGQSVARNKALKIVKDTIFVFWILTIYLTLVNYRSKWRNSNLFLRSILFMVTIRL